MFKNFRILKFLNLSLLLCTTIFTSSYSEAQTYCPSVSANVNYEWIKGVTINGTTNSSAATTYSNFTSVNFNAQLGQNLSVQLTPGYNGTSVYPESWAIWIDLNKDSIFDDATERVFKTTNAVSGIVNGNISIPSGALTGSTRLRVAMRYGGEPLACGNFTYGEVEDYQITLSAPVTTLPETFLDLESAPNHWVGQGVDKVFTEANGTFTLRPAYNNDPKTGLSIHFQPNDGGSDYTLEFDAPGDALLSAGTYSNIYRFPFNSGNQAGMSISGGSRGCNQVKGNFTVLEVTYNLDGSFRTFAATFNHYCDSDTTGPLLKGSIFYGTSTPTSTYCSATANNTRYEWIAGVSIGTFSNTVNSNLGYEDFTESVTSKTIKVVPGSQVQAQLKPGYLSSAYPERWAIWIDLNRDGDFADAGEEIFRNANASNSTQNPILSIPQSLNAKTRMRVRMWYEATAASSCGATYYGQVEDYTIEPQTPPQCTNALAPMFDALATWVNGSPTISTNSNGINVQSYPLANVERRGIFEYNLSQIPLGATITSASITFRVNTYTSNSNQGSGVLSLHGYNGNGTASSQDAVMPNNLVGKSAPISGLGNLVITLDPAKVGAAMGTSRILGLLGRNDTNNQQVGVDTLESVSNSPGRLTVCYQN